MDLYLSPAPASSPPAGLAGPGLLIYNNQLGFNPKMIIFGLASILGFETIGDEQIPQSKESH